MPLERPAEAIAWGQLMQDNNGASALAVCHKKLSKMQAGDIIA